MLTARRRGVGSSLTKSLFLSLREYSLRQGVTYWLIITSTLLGAGHETTVTSLGWILLELAAHPDEQREVRNEVCAARAAEHPDDIGMTNLDALPLLNAVIKVNATHVYLTLA